MIYINIDEVFICNNDGSKYVIIFMEDFFLVGIWIFYYSEINFIVFFLCIEFWYGFVDSINFNKIYKDKKFINKFSKGKVFIVFYNINIY